MHWHCCHGEYLLQHDLKGSTVGKRVLKAGKTATSSTTLKNLDLTHKIYIGAENKALFMEQLKKDVRFLASHHIMDYSLLLGIHDHRQEQNYRALTTGNLITNDGFEIVTRGSRHPQRMVLVILHGVLLMKRLSCLMEFIHGLGKISVVSEVTHPIIQSIIKMKKWIFRMIMMVKAFTAFQ